MREQNNSLELMRAATAAATAAGANLGPPICLPAGRANDHNVANVAERATSGNLHVPALIHP